MKRIISRNLVSLESPAPVTLRSLANNWRSAAIMFFCAMLVGVHTLKAADTRNGSLLLVAKGDVEVFHNGRKIVLRDKSDDKFHFRVKLPERPFKAGDSVVLRVRSPYVYRAIAAAIDLSGNAGQIPVKKSDWRFLGEDKDPAKITAADIEAGQERPATTTPDPVGESEREKLRLLPESKGGSEWVRTERQLNGPYCIGFVLTAEMLKSPLK